MSNLRLAAVRAASISAIAAILWTPAVLAARDRPGTPNEEDAAKCNNSLTESPAVCVVFNNTASEPVGFDAEFTVDGVAVVGSARPKAVELPSWVGNQKTGCMIGCTSITPYKSASNEAAYDFNPDSFAYAWAKGKMWSLDESGSLIPPQGLKIKDLDYDTEYCFRFKARRQSDDVVSEQWCNWACARTDAEPPPKPSSPYPVTTEYHEGGKDWRVKPPKVVVRWERSATEPVNDFETPLGWI